jgi:hypothetical protein
MEVPEHTNQRRFNMSSKQAASCRKTRVPGHGGSGRGQTLKSERVQLRLQLPERERRRVQEACGGRVTVSEEVVVSFELRAVPVCLKGGNGIAADLVEAGSAFGTPSHTVQPSTLRKEEDHGTA